MASLSKREGSQAFDSFLQEIKEALAAQRKKLNLGWRLAPLCLNLVITGGPGADFKALAHRAAQFFKAAGILTKGHLVDFETSLLLSTSKEQSNVKIRDVFETALGGVLFIEPACNLLYGDRQESFLEPEALEALAHFVGQNRTGSAIILTGTKEDIKLFLERAPQLKTKFSHQFDFK